MKSKTYLILSALIFLLTSVSAYAGQIIIPCPKLPNLTTNTSGAKNITLTWTLKCPSQKQPLEEYKPDGLYSDAFELRCEYAHYYNSSKNTCTATLDRKTIPKCKTIKHYIEGEDHYKGFICVV